MGCLLGGAGRLRFQDRHITARGAAWKNATSGRVAACAVQCASLPGVAALQPPWQHGEEVHWATQAACHILAPVPLTGQYATCAGFPSPPHSPGPFLPPTHHSSTLLAPCGCLQGLEDRPQRAHSCFLLGKEGAKCGVCIFKSAQRHLIDLCGRCYLSFSIHVLLLGCLGPGEVSMNGMAWKGQTW